jgi:hypothetical protein
MKADAPKEHIEKARRLAGSYREWRRSGEVCISMEDEMAGMCLQKEYGRTRRCHEKAAHEDMQEQEILKEMKMSLTSSICFRPADIKEEGSYTSS